MILINKFSTSNKPHIVEEYVHGYKDIIYLPSVSDKNFKNKLSELFNSLERDSYYILLFYTYKKSIVPLKTGDTLISSGIYYCNILYKSPFSIDDLFDFIKISFLKEVNYFEEKSLTQFSDRQKEWIDKNEISFVKIFNLGKRKSITIDNSNKFSIDIEEMNIYNDSKSDIFKGKSINPYKALIYSQNGISVRK